MINSIKIITAFGLIYLVICSLMYFKQRSFLYFPTAETMREDIKANILLINGQRLKVWQINPGQKNALLYFGGNGEDVAKNVDVYRRLFPGQTINLANYRGYGGSEGEPSESALLSDALAIYDHLQQDYVHISIVGRSLGSGVAVHIASQRTVKKLVLITPYDSIEKLAKEKFKWLPVSSLLHDKFDSQSLVDKITAPSLVLAAENDKVIPNKHTLRLVSGFKPEIINYQMIENTGHNTIENNPKFYQLVKQFLQESE